MGPCSSLLIPLPTKPSTPPTQALSAKPWGLVENPSLLAYPWHPICSVGRVACKTAPQQLGLQWNALLEKPFLCGPLVTLVPLSFNIK